MRRYLTPEHRLVQRMLLSDLRGDPFDRICRLAQVAARECDVDMLADQVRHMIAPMVGVPILIGVGTNAQTVAVLRGTSIVYLTATGSTTFTTTKTFTASFVGIAAGGGGGAANAATVDQNGGGGAGGGCSTLGTALILVVGKTYTEVNPTGGTSNNAGGDLTWNDGVSNVVLLKGGSGGGDITGGAGGAAGSSTGSNLNTGGAGGTGSTEAVGASTVGTAQTSGAGGGGGGDSADGAGGAKNGGAGKDEAGGAAAPGAAGNGGRGGGMDINGTKYGWGGGGANNDNVNNRGGTPGQSGAAKLVA